MNINLINELSSELKYKRTDLIEKDLLLHQLLIGLSSDGFFSNSFMFKGGTCLIKAYLGYFRFSEDIDFTYTNQSEFKGMSGRKVTLLLSALITKTALLLEGIASERKMDFKADKSNKEYMELGGSGRTATFKVWYDSAVLKRRSFIKMQINFVEAMCFNPVRKKLNSLAVSSRKNIEMLYPEYKEYARKMHLMVYDKRDIAAEKIRAILTRRGIKARDFLDLYMLHKRFKIEPSGVEACAIRKTKLALKMYGKYRENMEEKSKRPISLPNLGAEEEMLLKEVDKMDFYAFSKELEAYVNGLIKRFNNGK